jgi:hypothetical protein
MPNKDKRARRAKLKAKAVRVQKHKEKINMVHPASEITKISPDFIELFKTLPDFSDKYECVPFIKKYLENSVGSSHMGDAEVHVAMVTVLYGHWFTTGSDSIDRAELINAGDFLLEQEGFINSFNSLVIH